MEMRGRGSARRADIADQISPFHLRSFRDGELGHVQIERGDALPVVDAHEIAVDVELANDLCDPIGHRVDGRSGGAPLIDSGVVISRAFPVMKPLNTKR